MKKHVKSITYEPKIEPVIDGRCTQTIRKGRKVAEGDEILFHGRSGLPRRSKQSWDKRVKVVETVDIKISSQGILIYGNLHAWASWYADCLADFDYIDPPTGEALRDVLFGLNGTPKKPEEYQIIRWKQKPPEDCTTMLLYGDGKKFLHPVWYSCGRCTPCPRDPEAKI